MVVEGDKLKTNLYNQLMDQIKFTEENPQNDTSFATEMKSIPFLLYPCLRIFSIVILLMGGLCHAYGQIVEYQYEVRFKDGRTGKVDSTQAVYYYHRMNADKARETYEKAKTAASNYTLYDQLRSLGFKSADRGRFTFAGRNGMGVVIRTEYNDLFLIIHNDGNWEGKSISEGCKASCTAIGPDKYRYIITINANTATDNVHVQGKYRPTPSDSCRMERQ